MDLTKIVVAGSEKYGSGALVGWDGIGALRRSWILEVLEEAHLPLEWAPRAKSAVGHAGQALKRLNLHGYIVRRAKSAGRSSAGARRYQARWTVVRADTAESAVGDAAGRVVLTVEIRDGSDQLWIEGDAPADHPQIRGSVSLAAWIEADYRALRDGELYQAGDVTSWIRGILYAHCGAVRFGVGYYVPAGGRDVASRLALSLSRRWGASWICPLLPVATSDELAQGVGRGLHDDVRTVERALATARDKARAESRVDVSAAVAARLLADLATATERTAAYEALFGAECVREARTLAASLRAELESLSDDSSERFALVTADLPATPPQPATQPQRVAPAIRAAEQAAAERRPVAPAPAPVQPAIDPDDDTSARFALLELDLPAPAPAPKPEALLDLSDLIPASAPVASAPVASAPVASAPVASAPVASAPRRLVGTPAKLRSGDWGARVQGPADVGDTVQITTRSGKSWPARVTGIAWSGRGVTLVETESLEPRQPSRSVRGFGRRSCVTGGNCSSMGSGRNCGGHDCDGY